MSEVRWDIFVEFEDVSLLGFTQTYVLTNTLEIHLSTRCIFVVVVNQFNSVMIQMSSDKISTTY